MYPPLTTLPPRKQHRPRSLVTVVSQTVRQIVMAGLQDVHGTREIATRALRGRAIAIGKGSKGSLGKCHWSSSNSERK